jgi:serine/threonine-protein kinase
MATAPAPRSDAKVLADVNEQDLVRAVLDRGFATQGEIDHCRALQERLSRKDQYKSVIELLVEQGAVTATQVKRLQQAAGDNTKFKQIPGYQVLSTIGQGSMGVVLKARQLSMDRVVAIKILLKQLAANKEFIDRFFREAKIAAKLAHNNVVQAIDSGEIGGQYYFIMEYVDGTNIKKELDKPNKVYEEKEAVRIILQVAEALEHANQKGLIHRDIKPENIMLTKDGTAKLADLGLARLTTDEQMAQAEKGIAIGTPYYISPEQIRGSVDVNIQTDIYSLGATLYHMVTGRVPFAGRTPHEVMKKHLNEELVPPDHINQRLSSRLGEVVETMMAKKRENRYANPTDLMLDLRALLGDKPPLIARQRVSGSALQALTDGDEAEDAPATAPQLHRQFEAIAAQLNQTRLAAIVLGLFLAGSVLVNLALLLMR